MPDWLQRDWCSSFVLTLGHFLWQGILVAALLAIVLRVVRSVAARYWLSLVALLLMAVCPIVTFGWLLQPETRAATNDAPPVVRDVPAANSTSGDVPIADRSDAGPQDLKWPSREFQPVPIAEPPKREVDVAMPTSAPISEDRWWQKFAPQLMATYLGGVALMLLRLVAGLWGGRRLRRRVQLIDDSALLAAMQRQATALGLKLKLLPVLAYCERVTVPTVVGVLKPMILLPIALTSGLSPEQIESVLAHELAHLRRYDHLVNLLQRVIESLLFFHPAMWWVSHRIRQEREHCCDDLVVACGAMPLDYAKSLLRVAELSRATKLRRSVAAVSLLATDGKPSNLRQRIARLLGESATPNLRLSPRALLLTIAIPLVALIATIQSGASSQPASMLDGEDDATATRSQALPGNENPLQRVASVSASDMPLRSALEMTARSAGLKLELDGEALKQVGLDVQTPVTLTLDGVSLESILSLIVDWRNYPGALYEVRGENLVVTSLEARQKRIAGLLPEWMKPLFNHGLLASLDENNNVVSVTTSSIVTDELLAKFAALPHLKELYVEVTKGVTPAGLASLGKMTRLQKLSVYQVNTAGAGLGDDVIRNVIGLDSLRALSVSECGTTDAGAKLLEKLPQLTSLDLRQEGKLTDEALKSIGKLTKLESLSLNSYVGTERFGWVRFSEEAVRELRGLKQLKSLHLVGHEVPADALEFPLLTSLTMGHPSVGDEVVTKLGQLRALQNIELTYGRFGNNGLKAIASLPDLRYLSISGSTIDDAGMEVFRSNHTLRHLSLRVSGLTDKTLEHVGQITNLSRLDLYGSGSAGVAPGRNFGIKGLQQLKGLRLKTLYLTNFDVVGGYAGLKELQQLRELSMMMCNITDTELAALEEALPNTTITHMTGGGGWMPKQLRKQFPARSQAQPGNASPEAPPPKSPVENESPVEKTNPSPPTPLPGVPGRGENDLEAELPKNRPQAELANEKVTIRLAAGMGSSIGFLRN